MTREIQRECYLEMEVVIGVIQSKTEKHLGRTLLWSFPKEHDLANTVLLNF